jgi:hypothetical protein
MLVQYYYQIQLEIALNPYYVYLYEQNNTGAIIISGYDVLENNTSLNLSSGEYSMWFSEPDKKIIANLSDQSKINLEISLNIDAYSYVYYDADPTLVNNVQFQFSDGFYYVHPATNAINFTQKLIEDCPYSTNDTTAIDSRCLRSYQEMKDFYILRKDDYNLAQILFNAPNLMIGSNGIITTEFCFAPLTASLQFDNVICIDYNFAGAN